MLSFASRAGTYVRTNIQQVGPGLVNLMYNLKGLGRVLLCQVGEDLREFRNSCCLCANSSELAN